MVCSHEAASTQKELSKHAQHYPCDPENNPPKNYRSVSTGSGMRSMQTVQELLLADLGIGVTLGTAWVTLGIAGGIVDAVQDVVRNGLTPTQLTHGEYR